jgi:RNA ligase (TIGR02306 family)
MSEFVVPVVRINKVERHPNADTLSVTEAEGCPVIFRTGDYQVGDLAIYVPVEAVVPLSNPAFAFLSNKEGKTTERIKAKKLRGIFSMGLLVPLSTAYGDLTVERLIPSDLWGRAEGRDVRELLGITKYVEPEKNIKLGGGNRERAVDAHTAPIYDIESHRKYRHLYQPGEEVVVTEKIHGCNGRFVFRQGDEDAEPRLYVGSRNHFLREGDDVWWRVARQYGLAEKLARWPNVVLYGEVYGQVQDLKYGTNSQDPLRFAAFDAYDKGQGRYLDYVQFHDLCEDLGVPTVPALYQGPYDPGFIEPLALGKSVLADQIKEGIVIKPTVNRWDQHLGRVITKLVGEQYLLRKNGTEHQ